MTQLLTIAYKTSHHHREKIFAILMAAIIITACAYVFLLQKAIVNVVQRQKVALETKSVSADVGTLEETYFSLENGITLNLAYSKGLKNADDVSYISKKPVTAMVIRHEL